MKAVAFCLSLLLAFSASANSLEDALCRTTTQPVARMENAEKLCHSLLRALTQLPEAVTQDAQGLLTPQNLALMGTLTAAWLGSQGVPVVGEVVDAALLTLGVVLLAEQSRELVTHVWTYVNRATTARSTEDLDASATHLARAISLVGINVVAFILTKKAMAEVPRGPPEPPRRFVFPQGGRGGRSTTGMAAESAASTTTEPEVLMMGHSGQNGESPEREIRPTTKTPDPATFEKWLKPFQRKPVPAKPKDPYDFQRRYAGGEEVLVLGGGEEIWADGARASDAYLIEVKFIEKPDTSPFVVGSACDDAVRQIIRNKLAKQFSRYAAVIGDPVTPAVGLEVVVNDSRAVAFFESLLREFGIPGRVVVRP